MIDTTAQTVKAALAAHQNPEKARHMQRFFKTGPGQYGEGDLFWGIATPTLRAVARQHAGLPLPEIHTLLQSPIHEQRATALIILTHRYRKAKDAAARDEIAAFYLAHTPHINNWDLVDISCPLILGTHLLTRDRSILHRLIESPDLWEQRIALISTLTFIRNNQPEETFLLVEKILSHPHDLIHKAAGWMLRETGKLNRPLLLAFLDRHHAAMPRTMLRYAIEHLPPNQRAHYMEKRNSPH